MKRRQPDTRIHPHELGMMFLYGNRYVVNLRRGVPFNACIEEFNEHLRCWASHETLDRRAAAIVDEFSAPTNVRSFVWKEDVKRGPLACIKGGHELFKVVLP